MMPDYYLNQDLLSYIGGLVQERSNSIANVLELHDSCTNPAISGPKITYQWIDLSHEIWLKIFFFKMSHFY